MEHPSELHDCPLDRDYLYSHTVHPYPHTRDSKTVNVKIGNGVAAHYLQQRGELINYVNSVVEIDLRGRHMRSYTTICLSVWMNTYASIIYVHLVLKLVANNESQVLKSKLVEHHTILINILWQS